MTGIPTVTYSHYFENAKQAEKILHKNIKQFRVNKDREFFNCSLETAINEIDALKIKGEKKFSLSEYLEIENAKLKQYELEKINKEQKVREEEYRKRQIEREKRKRALLEKEKINREILFSQIAYTDKWVNYWQHAAFIIALPYMRLKLSPKAHDLLPLIGVVIVASYLVPVRKPLNT